MSIYSRLKTTSKVLLHGLPHIETPTYPAPENRYDHLINYFSQRNPVQMIEIGVWRGDRTAQFLSHGIKLRRFVGFDLFENMTAEKYDAESMGNCVPHSKTAVLQRISNVAVSPQCKIEL